MEDPLIRDILQAQEEVAQERLTEGPQVTQGTLQGYQTVLGILWAQMEGRLFLMVGDILQEPMDNEEISHLMVALAIVELTHQDWVRDSMFQRVLEATPK